MADPLSVGTGDRVIFPDVTAMDGHSEERMIRLRGRRLRLVGILAAPLVMAGYVGLAVLLFLPLLGMRMMFPRGSTSSVRRLDRNVPLDSGVRKLGNAATRRA